jgi:hypothetical protein
VNPALQLRAGFRPDLVDQTTARLNALNETLRAIALSSSDPMLQSQAERNERELLRREVYAEIGRLVGPEPVVEVVKSPVSAGAGDVVVTGAPDPAP